MECQEAQTGWADVITKKHVGPDVLVWAGERSSPDVESKEHRPAGIRQFEDR
jgi:hypothetical protein